MRLTAALLLLLLHLPTSQAQLQPQSTEAHYIAYWHGAEVAAGSQRFSIAADGHYKLHSESSARGLLQWLSNDQVTESSQGQIKDGAVLPEQYDYHHQNRLGTKRKGQVMFDWAQQQVTNHVADSRWQMAIPEGTQDKASMQLALLHGLREGQTDMLFQVADGGKLKEYRFYVTGTEQLETALGSFATIKLAREKNGRAPRVWLWCAPGLGYLPVRIVRERRGRRVTLDIVSLKH